jgi:cathepsin L
MDVTVRLYVTMAYNLLQFSYFFVFEGGLMDNAFKYVQENGGLDTEESYSYHARQSKCHYKPQNSGTTCSGYVDITSQSEDALKEAVATIGPISVAIDATQDKFMLYKSGVFIDPTCNNQPDNLDHGVLVVGYGTENDKDYWIVKNSWGSHWGEGGYIRMARNKENMCGVATSASYPLVNNNM